MKKEKTTKSLLGAWVCELANNLMNECETPMTRTEAFRRAHLARELVVALGQGVVVFEYKKKNGEERRARGTLCKGVSDEYDAYEYKEKDKENRDNYSKVDIPYWDLDKEAFRNFSVVNVKRIVEVVIKSKNQNSPDLIEFV